MTLEKLLLIGFALAVVTALAVTARNMVEDDTSPRNDRYRQGVGEMLEPMR